MAKSNKAIRCRLFNKEADFDLDVPDFSMDTLTSIFANPEVLNSLSFTFTVPKEYAKWILEEPDLTKVFTDIADFLHISLDRLIQLYFFYVVNEDSSAYAAFADTKYTQKQVFLKAFRDFNAKFIEDTSKIKNPVAPDILYCLVVYILLYQYPQIHDFEIPMNILVHILNIENEMKAPDDFDPNIPYETDIIAEDKKLLKAAKKQKKVR